MKCKVVFTRKFYFQTIGFLFLCLVFLRLVLYKIFCKGDEIEIGSSTPWISVRLDSSQVPGIDRASWTSYPVVMYTPQVDVK